jgi:hypothetical protein
MPRKQATLPTKIADSHELMLEALCHEVRALTVAQLLSGGNIVGGSEAQLEERVLEHHRLADRLIAASYGKKVPLEAAS